MSVSLVKGNFYFPESLLISTVEAEGSRGRQVQECKMVLNEQISELT